MKQKIKITEHAYDRAKKRLRWSENTLDRMAINIFVKGISKDNAKGKLKSFFVKINDRNNQCNNIRIFGNNIFYFNNNVLITIIPLPLEIKNYIQSLNKN